MSKSKKKKKNNKVINNNNQENLTNKKILDGVDLKKEKKIETFDKKKLDNEIEEINHLINKSNINEHIQTFISILFSVIIFIAFLLLIFILYNNYLKKDDKPKCNELEVCKSYIKKDYGIKEEEVSNFIKKLRGIIYNIEEYNNKNITNTDLLNFATYFIWGSDNEYLLCNHDLDTNCLVSKKEMNYLDLEKYFQKYLNIKNSEINFNNDFIDDSETRIYKIDNKVILTFKEFEYETLKHDIIDIQIDENNVEVIFALSKKIPDNELYSYVGFKKLKLKYLDKRFIIENVKTSLN